MMTTEDNMTTKVLSWKESKAKEWLDTVVDLDQQKVELTTVPKWAPSTVSILHSEHHPANTWIPAQGNWLRTHDFHNCTSIYELGFLFLWTEFYF